MKKILSFFTFVIMSVLLCFTTKSQNSINVGGINYNIIDNINNYVEVCINSNNVSASIVIDSVIEYNNIQYTVTRIGDSAFMECSNLTLLSLPATITSIGLNAFVNSGLCSPSSTLIIYSIQPPTIEGNPFSTSGQGRTPVLHIPCATFVNYQDSSYDLWRNLAQAPQIFFRGIEGDRVIQSYDTICRGPYIYSIYNPYIQDSTQPKREVIQQSGYRLIETHIPNIQGCKITGKINITVRSQGSYNEETHYICPNTTFTWSNEEHNFDTIIGNFGEYIFSFPAGECNDITVLKVIASESKRTEQTIDRCKGESYLEVNPVDSSVYYYRENADFEFPLHTFRGCDSIVVKHLRFQPLGDDSTYREICKGNTIYWTVQGYDSVKQRRDSVYVFDTDTLDVGTHTIIDSNYTTRYGCSNKKTLFITINPLKFDTIRETICWNELPYNRYNFNIDKSDSLNVDTLIVKQNKNVTYNGCDSTSTLLLTIKPTKNVTIRDSICFGSGYHANGFDVDGDTVQAFQGTTRTITKVNHGQTYLGCDSTTTLYLVFLNNKERNINEQICYGSVYNQNNFSINSSDYNNEYQIIKDTNNNLSYLGCDSTTILSLTITPTYNQTFTDTICYGSSYNQHGFNISFNNYKHYANYNSNWDTIQYSKTKNLHTKTYNCDSIVTLNLLIQPKFDTTIYANICLDGSYNEWGFNLRGDELGIGTFNRQRLLQRVTGCDSIINLQLTVSALLETNISASICFGETYNLNGFNINTNDSTARNTSFYIKDSLLLQTIAGCDSTVRLSLKVNPNFEQSIRETICDNETFDFNGRILNTAGNYDTTLQTINGCDSIVHLQLNVNPTKSSRIDTSVCEGFVSDDFYGFEVNTIGMHDGRIYTDTRTIPTLTGGCDSTVVLNVTVHPAYKDTVLGNICFGETYSDYGFNVASTDYNNEEQVLYFTNRERSVWDCDSLMTLVLTIHPVCDTTITENICWGQTYSENNFNILTSDSIENPINNMGIINSILKLQTINGCDSIVHLNLNVYPIIDTSITVEICDNETFDFNGRILNTAGNYDTTLQTINGCDSVVHLSLIVYPTFDTTIIDSICFGATYTLNNFNESQAGNYTQNLQSQYGCDSIVHLELKVINFNDTIEIHLCEGQSYDLHGRILNESGFYRDTLKSIWQCDSIINIDLTVHSNYNDTIYDTICSNFAYNLYNFHIDSAEYLPYTTNYRTQNVQSIWGCDSVVTLALWVWPAYEIHIEKEICEGGHYTDHGYELYFVTQDTTKVVSSFVSSHGCDSIFVLNLYVRPTYDSTIFANICRGETFTMEGYDFNCTESGVYKDTLRSAYSCDSIKTINLTVHDHYELSITDSICLGGVYQRDGFYCTAPGIYKDTLQTFWGCDSIRTLFLWPKSSYNISVDTSICSGSDYYFGDRLLTYSGQYIDTFSTVGGCDSIVTLYLTFNAPYMDSIEASICEGEVYNLHGFYVTETGRYIDTFTTVGGCDSIRILNLHVKPSYHDTIEQTICSGEIFSELGFHADRPGYYTHSGNTYLGCDSTIILHLNVNDKVFDTLNVEICEGEEYRENNFNENNTGVYDRHLETSYGCDSIITLNLTVNKVYNDTISAVIKEGNTFDLYNFYEDQDGVYSQYLTSSKGCDSTVTLVLEIDRDAKLFIPNAFTPLDRYNNTFCVYPQEEIVHLKSFKIFNRWGTLLWQSDDITQCWNGTYQGKFVPQGAYVFKVEYYRDTEPNEILEEKGSVMVLY